MSNGELTFEMLQEAFDSIPNVPLPPRQPLIIRASFMERLRKEFEDADDKVDNVSRLWGFDGYAISDERADSLGIRHYIDLNDLSMALDDILDEMD
jgi:hypothetical protein